LRKHARPKTRRQFRVDYSFDVFHQALRLDLADIQVESSLGATPITPAQNRHCVPATDQAFEVGARQLVGASAEIQDVREINGVLAANEIARHESSRSEDHRDALEEIAAGADMALRLGGHLGPVYHARDPILERDNFFGAHVSRAARIRSANSWRARS